MTNGTGARQPEALMVQNVSEVYEWHMSEVRATEKQVEDAREAAIELIIAAGFDSGDSDYFGAEHGDIVQTLLMCVMVRVPQLREALLKGGVDIDLGVTD